MPLFVAGNHEGGGKALTLGVIRCMFGERGREREGVAGRVPS